MECTTAVFNKYESGFYLLAWIIAVFYSIYEVYVISNSFIYIHDVYTDFAPGWRWIGRPKDISDQEWRTWIPLMYSLIPWIIVHHCTSHIIKKFLSTTILCSWYVFVSTTFLCYYVGLSSLLCILAQLSIQYALTFKRTKTVMWLVHVSFLFVIHFLKTPDHFFQYWLQLTDEEHYIVTLTMCWAQLRSISHSIDSTYESNDNNRSHRFGDMIKKLAYCLYLPTLCMGPLILYHEFQDSLNKPVKSWNTMWLIRLTSNMCRYTFWLYFTEFSVHFLYFNAISYYPEIVQYLNPWALYGLGYCMGQYFLNKYVVVYGINAYLCKADGVPAPPQPKCIGRIHLYSDMWKYFDRGLYKFLMRYIYLPALTSQSYISKMIASFICFTFVSTWHGVQTNIFTWAFLNYIGLALEGCAKVIGRTRKYRTIQEKYLSPQNILRFNCLLASPLLAMSALSNFYFFAGQEIGDIYVQRIFHDSWNTVPILLFILYCCCQVSTNVKRYEIEKANIT